MLIEHGNQKILLKKSITLLKLTFPRKILNGTTAKTETLKIVFANLIFSLRRYGFWLECSTLTHETVA